MVSVLVLVKEIWVMLLVLGKGCGLCSSFGEGGVVSVLVLVKEVWSLCLSW